jgi:nicotinate-nucleotide adenylyltransferase
MFQGHVIRDSEQVRIGVFGGSFDPIHIGHLIVVEAAADALALDVVHMIPARMQPFKTGSLEAGPEHRVAMARLAIQDNPRLVLDLREIQREGPSYTVDSLRELRDEKPDDELCLLVGADAAREISQWHEAEQLRRLATVVVLSRPGVEPPKNEIFDRFIKVPAIGVSATDVRDTLRRGGSVRYLVPPAVAAYIESRGLYRM